MATITSNALQFTVLDLTELPDVGIDVDVWDGTDPTVHLKRLVFRRAPQALEELNGPGSGSVRVSLWELDENDQRVLADLSWCRAGNIVTFAIDTRIRAGFVIEQRQVDWTPPDGDVGRWLIVSGMSLWKLTDRGRIFHEPDGLLRSNGGDYRAWHFASELFDHSAWPSATVIKKQRESNPSQWTDYPERWNNPSAEWIWDRDTAIGEADPPMPIGQVYVYDEITIPNPQVITVEWTADDGGELWMRGEHRQTYGGPHAWQQVSRWSEYVEKSGTIPLAIRAENLPRELSASNVAGVLWTVYGQDGGTNHQWAILMYGPGGGDATVTLDGEQQTIEWPPSIETMLDLIESFADVTTATRIEGDGRTDGTELVVEVTDPEKTRFGQLLWDVSGLGVANEVLDVFIDATGGTVGLTLDGEEATVDPTMDAAAFQSALNSGWPSAPALSVEETPTLAGAGSRYWIRFGVTDPINAVTVTNMALTGGNANAAVFVVQEGGAAADPTAAGLNRQYGLPGEILAQSGAQAKVLGYPDVPPAMTPSEVARHVLEEGRDRSVSAWGWVTLDATDAADSAGLEWGDIVFDQLTSIGITSLGDLLQMFVDLGIDVNLRYDGKIQLWQSRGLDRSEDTSGGGAVVIKEAWNLLAGLEDSREDPKNWLALRWAGGWTSRQSLTSQSQYGRIEDGVTAPQIEAEQTAHRLGDHSLNEVALPSGTKVVQIVGREGAVPFFDFGVGDTVLLEHNDGDREALRVASISFEETDDATVLYTLELGDRRRLEEDRLERQVKALQAGSLRGVVLSSRGLPEPIPGRGTVVSSGGGSASGGATGGTGTSSVIAPDGTEWVIEIDNDGVLTTRRA